MDTEKKEVEVSTHTDTKKHSCVVCGKETCGHSTGSCGAECKHHKVLDISTGIKFGFGLGVGLACAFTLFALFVAPLLSFFMAPLMYGGMMHRGWF